MSSGRDTARTCLRFSASSDLNTNYTNGGPRRIPTMQLTKTSIWAIYSNQVGELGGMAKKGTCLERGTLFNTLMSFSQSTITSKNCDCWVHSPKPLTTASSGVAQIAVTEDVSRHMMDSSGFSSQKCPERSLANPHPRSVDSGRSAVGYRWPNVHYLPTTETSFVT